MSVLGEGVAVAVALAFCFPLESLEIFLGGDFTGDSFSSVSGCGVGGCFFLALFLGAGVSASDLSALEPLVGFVAAALAAV